jgi:hypothetical protein
MNSYVYSRNYGMIIASKKLVENNKQYLKRVLPLYEHHNLDLYLVPRGNISRDCLGKLKQDINKILDNYPK